MRVAAKAKKSLALGRGLGAILGEVEQAYENGLNDDSGLVVELDVDLISPNPFQPRRYFDLSALEELSTSIVEHGLLQPVLVCQNETGEGYFLVAGERRLRASKLAKLVTIKAIVIDLPANKLREIALIENIQREDLNPIELAHSYRELLEEHGITHDELAKKISKSRVQITNTLRLLSLDQQTQEELLSGRITQGHAKILVGLDLEQQRVAVNSIVGQRLNVRETEALAKTLKDTSKPSPKQVAHSSFRAPSLDFVAVEQLLACAKRAGFDAAWRGSKLVVEFRDNDALRKLMNLLSKSGN